MPFNWEFIPGRKGLNIGTISGGKWFSLSSTLSNYVPLTLRTRHKVELMKFFDWFLLKPYKTIHGLPMYMFCTWFGFYIKLAKITSNMTILLAHIGQWGSHWSNHQKTKPTCLLSALVICDPISKKNRLVEIELGKVRFYIIIL